ncbi:MAG: Spy/CpxP family protein refolding chaperone [Desulfobacterales bacterium]|jgi:Spy/CpxP family protein refolding chaperone
MKSKKVIGFVIAGILIVTGTFILTGRLMATGENFFKWRSAFGMHRGIMGMNMFMDLNLSDAQKDQVQAIITKYRDQREDMRDEFRQTMRDTMFNAIFADEFNEESVREAFRKSSEAREDMVVQKAKMIAEIKTILDQDQIELLKERKSRMMEKGRGCGGFGKMMFKTWCRNNYE